MVSHNIVEHKHQCPNEIEGHYIEADTSFGNIHIIIIAFGDLNQLSQVYGSRVFSVTTCKTSFHF